MRVLGIDPGLTGGAAIIITGGDLDGKARMWGGVDLPTAGDAHKRRIDPFKLRDWIIAGRPDIGFIERAQAFPGMHASSVFVYGRAVGALETCVRMCNVPLHVVEPSMWKKYFELPGVQKVGAAKAKEAARQLVIAGLDEATRHMTLKKDHGIAEAALIAMYGADMIERGEISLRRDPAQTDMVRSLLPQGMVPDV